uniref:ATP synthase complex subunit 8 n=1 Tax=Stilpnonotus mexicanus TaxID=1205652 RepID=A0A0S2MQX3_9CUCU|nr:ATP synthase F0 subunit 8 [Stilpnonotus mexicanus]
MPQMAPMSWLALMTFFILAFLLFNSMNYYSFTYKKKNLTIQKKTSHNWKW